MNEDCIIIIDKLGIFGKEKYRIGCSIIETYKCRISYRAYDYTKKLLYQSINNACSIPYSISLRGGFTFKTKCQEEKELVDEIIQRLLNLKV